MTCAIAFPYENGAESGMVVAADRYCGDGIRVQSRTRKVWKIRNSVIAGAGNISDIQHAVRAWSGTDLSPDALANILTSTRPTGAAPDAEFIVLGPDGLTHVDCSGAISEPVDGHIGIGAGGDFAVGYLSAALALAPEMDAKTATRLAKACLKEVVRHIDGVSPPFDVVVI